MIFEEKKKILLWFINFPGSGDTPGWAILPYSIGNLPYSDQGIVNQPLLYSLGPADLLIPQHKAGM